MLEQQEIWWSQRSRATWLKHEDRNTIFFSLESDSEAENHGVVHKFSIAYHPQTNGQAQVSNREIKKILGKMVQPNKKEWDKRLVDALSAYRTTYKALIGMPHFRLVFCRACHRLVEVENRSYLAAKCCNLSFVESGMKRKLELQQLEELRLEAYKSSKIYKEKTKFSRIK
ncbi:uncharacterized protein LOC130724743 [Lotus japonicus]|uniref:uncharacterized protein LOC130724743 n=1 Tax=Lotus japonicus TaxID=34305 RepID=UPI00258EDB58|nr:uncharacterized protein LOC130724743 [Lotus japonicus]